jgi:NitT/TauT family transport system substrate-binding protein
MRASKLIIAGVAALSLFAATSAGAEPVRIRLSWIVPVANWGSLLLEKKDLAKHLGQSYTLETTRFAGTPPLITALAAGELDIADFTFSTLPIAIQNAGIADLRVLTDEFQDGNPGYYSNEFMVLKDGPIKKVEDLKGQVIATNAVGSAVDIASRAMLRKHGLEDKRDYTTVEAPFPTMKAMLKEKKAALVPSILPFSFDPEMKQISRPLFSSRDALGISQFIVWSARKSFIDKNRAAMVDFMEDMMRIEHWFLDPKNHDEVEKIASKITKLPPERFFWSFTKQDYHRSPDMLPNLDALQSNINLTHELGFIKAPLDVKKYTDLSLAKEAADRLK